MHAARQDAFAKTAATLIKNLEKRNIEGYYCPTSADAVELVRTLVPEGASVTWGGSETLAETGVKALLTSGPYRVIDRSRATTPEEQRAVWRERTCADFHFMSANALTVSGEIVNIDGNADRLSLLLHGPEHVIMLVGANKIVTDVDAGIKRTRTHACPPNASRLHTNTPCELTGVCRECHAPQCMCCQVVVTRHSRHTGRIKVVLIGENLGF